MASEVIACRQHKIPDWKPLQSEAVQGAEVPYSPEQDFKLLQRRDLRRGDRRLRGLRGVLMGGPTPSGSGGGSDPPSTRHAVA